MAHPVQCPWIPFVSFKHGLLRALVLRNAGTRANDYEHQRVDEQAEQTRKWRPSWAL